MVKNGAFEEVFMLSDHIGEMVRYFRKQSGLSQQQLAQLTGVGKTVIFDIEKGKATIQLNSLLKVLDILNIQLKFVTPFPQPDVGKK
jgi:y4mF family transcriptional regulator